MTPTIPNSKILALIENLKGTCQSIDEACESLEIEWTDISAEQHMLIDREIFRCEECGWWHEMDEESESDPQHCDQCRPEED